MGLKLKKKTENGTHGNKIEVSVCGTNTFEIVGVSSELTNNCRIENAYKFLFL